MSTDQRYDEATVELVAGKAFVWHNGDDLENIRSVLGVLADVGLLLPPGGERYDQYGRRDESGRVERCCTLAHDSENFVHARADRRHTVMRVETFWTDGSEYHGPWTEVPDDDPA